MLQAERAGEGRRSTRQEEGRASETAGGGLRVRVR